MVPNDLMETPHLGAVRTPLGEIPLCECGVAQDEIHVALYGLSSGPKMFSE